MMISKKRRRLPHLILMTDQTRLPDPAAAIAGLPRGSAVILRHYDNETKDPLACDQAHHQARDQARDQIRQLAGLCRRRGIRLMIAGSGRLAAAAGAGGLHLAEHLARKGPGPWRLWRRPDWIITAAAHSPAAIFRAARAGADAVLLSPVFKTASHPNRAPIGTLRFAMWCRLSPLPVYALGGVDLKFQRRLAATGAVGLAGIGMFQAAEQRRTRPVRGSCV